MRIVITTETGRRSFEGVVAFTLIKGIGVVIITEGSKIACQIPISDVVDIFIHKNDKEK